jgi:hypothetical protein
MSCELGRLLSYAAFGWPGMKQPLAPRGRCSRPVKLWGCPLSNSTIFLLAIETVPVCRMNDKIDGSRSLRDEGQRRRVPLVDSRGRWLDCPHRPASHGLARDVFEDTDWLVISSY